MSTTGLKKRLARGAAVLGTLGAFALAQPAAAQEGVRLGENNTVTQLGIVSGAQTALSLGSGTAQNGVASIMTGR